MENIPSLSEILSYQLVLAEGVLPMLESLWNFFWSWGWIALPFFLWPITKEQWLFWRNMLWDEANNKQILLEIRIPGEILKPMRAMDVVLSGVWQLYGPPNWFEKWWEGQFDLSFSFEIAAIDGVPHFLIRIPKKQRVMFEQHIYGQYPEAEIFEVEDYTKMVPKNIPNERWDIWGTDYTMPKGDVYPLKTFRDFETEREAKEEKRIDPMASLMEGLSQLEEGEQIWIMIKAKPVTTDISDFPEKSKKFYEKLAGRKEAPPPLNPFLQVTSTMFGFPKQKENGGEDDIYPAEMKLTPFEKQTLESVERKRTRHLFDCFIRYVYIGRKDKFSVPKRIKIPMSYFNQFINPGLGFIVPYSATITKIKRNWYDWFWMLDKRLYVRKRKMFRSFLDRVPASWPNVAGDKDETFVLGSEELATLFHFPSRITVPPSAIPRVESRKTEAPHNLPIEEEENEQ
jgi:TusA-related sulfurtransferase